VVDGRRYVVGGRRGKAGSWRQGLNRDSGFRSQNEEHLLSAFCLLLTADCLLQLVGVIVGGTPGGAAVYDKMSPPKGEEKTSNFKK
jgi:hypothetical protein